MPRSPRGNFFCRHGIPPIIYRERRRHGCQLQRRPPIRLLSHPSPPSSLPLSTFAHVSATTFSLLFVRERSRAARIFHSTPATNYAITRKLAPRVGSGMGKSRFSRFDSEWIFVVVLFIGDLRSIKIWCKYFLYVWINFVKKKKKMEKRCSRDSIIRILKYIGIYYVYRVNSNCMKQAREKHFFFFIIEL